MLRIETRPNGHLKLTRGWWRTLDLSADETRLIARHADTRPEWPEGFADQLGSIGMAAIQFREWLVARGAPAPAIGKADALVDQLGRLAEDFGVHTETRNEEH